MDVGKLDRTLKCKVVITAFFKKVFSNDKTRDILAGF
jgi:hypothetical protein